MCERIVIDGHMCTMVSHDQDLWLTMYNSNTKTYTQTQLDKPAIFNFIKSQHQTLPAGGYLFDWFLFNKKLQYVIKKFNQSTKVKDRYTLNIIFNNNGRMYINIDNTCSKSERVIDMFNSLKLYDGTIGEYFAVSYNGDYKKITSIEYRDANSLLITISIKPNLKEVIVAPATSVKRIKTTVKSVI